MIVAAADNDEGLVKSLINDKVDVNSRDWDNLTALISASGKGHLNMAKFLVSKGAEVNLRDGRTPGVEPRRAHREPCGPPRLCPRPRVGDEVVEGGAHGESTIHTRCESTEVASTKPVEVAS